MKWNLSMFRALAAVAWADGNVKAAEADALVRTAKDLGFDARAVAEVERMTRERCSLDGFAPEGLDDAASEYLYALACMVRAADRDLAPAETECIAKLGDLLGLSVEARARAEIAALTIAGQQKVGASVFEELSAAVAPTR